MKRKQYRTRAQVYLSVEKDRWNDFVDLCDKERKSTSLKIDEMLTEELQKNEEGVRLEPDPIHIKRYSSRTNKSSQKPEINLDQWLPIINEVEDETTLAVLKGNLFMMMKTVDSRSMILYRKKKGIKF